MRIIRSIKNNILFQDNESAIKMETNGRNSCTGNSRHIEIKYFWVKDRVDRKEIRIQYCPTWLMLADYFTKALQGSLFVKYRNIIMGYTHIDEILCDKLYPLKERVGNLKKNRNVSEDSSAQTDKSSTAEKPMTRNKEEKESRRDKIITYADAVKCGTNSKK